MPRVAGSKDHISLAGGLVTEASPLAAPDGTTSDELNFLLEMNQGIRRRRKGYKNQNSDFTKTVSGATSSKILDTVYWREEDLFIVCISFAGADETWVRFHSNNSTYTYRGEYQIASSELTSVSISEVRGDIIITGEASGTPSDPILLTLDSSTLSVYSIDIYIRDFELVEDGLRISERPASLSLDHRYNLLNAGWYAERRLASTGAKGNTYTDFFGSQGVYPSNADISQIGLKVDEDGNEEFDPDTLVETPLGNSEAPRGHYVFNIEGYDRTARVGDSDNDGTVDSTLTLLGTVSL